jgi:MFS transporter, SET family, sugar efflux transporter
VSRHLTWALVGVAALVAGLQTAAINPNLALYATEQVGMTLRELSLFYLAFNVSALVSNVAIPFLTDKYGGKRAAFLLATLGTSTATVCLSSVSSFWIALTIAVVLLGPASSSLVLYFAYLRKTENGEKLVLQMRAMISLAWTLGPAGAAVVLQKFGISGLFLAVGFLAIFVLAVYPWLPKEQQNLNTTNTQQQDIVRGKQWTLLLLIFVLLQATNSIMVMATPLIVVNNLAEPLYKASYIFAICATIEIPLLIILGRFTNAIDPGKFVQAGAVIGVLYYLGLFFATSFSQLVALQALNALFVVCLKGNGMAWFQRIMPNQAGIATGLYFNTTRVGAMVGTPFAVAIVGIAGGNFRVAALLSAALSALSVGLLGLYLTKRSFLARSAHS